MARLEIRIIDVDPKLLAIVKKLAKESKRSVPKQAEIMLEQWLATNKIKWK